ncbi:hypothetical protein [Mycobacteroides chelonae]|jgi:hypothetical protein|uniref:Tail assembly chaperone n=1 Tax=Mycobacteroides chelonae TaxID=1774 RepID=A0AB73U5G7_MYCCH|nr:hypothetical protein [Mycobacteroides chelonae]MEC4842668.1 hypothetical protein [Mycobacteroides chelonae]MEC4847509.1 hypothetical protein [Mycobacteroides chelonae]OLT80581.1 hypothetical protein BKG57_11310 [Mycobacteroides chelonae]QDF71867.1 hypothetical protein FJK96_18045 [Mycobacteroides chelonae]
MAKAEGGNSPAQNEAEGVETIVVEYGGQSYTIPASNDDFPMLFSEAILRGNPFDALRVLLGGVQWVRYLGTEPTNKQFEEFSNVIAKATGMDSLGK